MNMNRREMMSGTIGGLVAALLSNGQAEQSPEIEILEPDRDKVGAEFNAKHHPFASPLHSRYSFLHTIPAHPDNPWYNGDKFISFSKLTKINPQVKWRMNGDLLDRQDKVLLGSFASPLILNGPLKNQVYRADDLILFRPMHDGSYIMRLKTETRAILYLQSPNCIDEQGKSIDQFTGEKLPNIDERKLTFKYVDQLVPGKQTKDTILNPHFNLDRQNDQFRDFNSRGQFKMYPSITINSNLTLSPDLGHTTSFPVQEGEKGVKFYFAGQGQYHSICVNTNKGVHEKVCTFNPYDNTYRTDRKK